MTNIYEDGTYLANNPTWHEQDSPWKARQVLKMIERNNLRPATVCEIGCGAGEILNQLTLSLPAETQFYGYEVSPQAYDFCSKKTKPNLTFRLENLLEAEGTTFDLMLVIDIFEHVEDYFGFIRACRDKATYKMFHIPLDLSAQSVFRGAPLVQGRKKLGHIHYFTKDTALETVRDCGYEIVDHFYTPGGIDHRDRGWKKTVLRMPRQLLSAASPDLAARLLGGFSLMVLAK